MKSKKSNKLTVSMVITIIILVIAVTFLITKTYFTQGGTSIVNEQGDTFVIPEDGNINLGDYFYSNFPEYFANRSTNCELASGDWVKTTDSIGCYDIPVWNNIEGCYSGEIRLMKLICETVGAEYTCEAHEVSCEVK